MFDFFNFLLEIMKIIKITKKLKNLKNTNICTLQLLKLTPRQMSNPNSIISDLINKKYINGHFRHNSISEKTGSTEFTTTMADPSNINLNGINISEAITLSVNMSDEMSDKISNETIDNNININIEDKLDSPDNPDKKNMDQSFECELDKKNHGDIFFCESEFNDIQIFKLEEEYQVEQKIEKKEIKSITQFNLCKTHKTHNTHNIHNTHKIQKMCIPLEKKINIHNKLPFYSGNTYDDQIEAFSDKMTIKKYNLILDLDETLIHTIPCANLEEAQFYMSHPDYMFSYKDIMTKKFIVILERPYMRQFLCKLYHIYNLFLYTNGKHMYAKRIIGIIECNLEFNPFINYYTRQYVDETFIKSIKNIEESYVNENNSVIVDDVKDVWPNYQDNLIVIKRYDGAQSCYGNSSDKVLNTLSEKLIEIANYANDYRIDLLQSVKFFKLKENNNFNTANTIRRNKTTTNLLDHDLIL